MCEFSHHLLRPIATIFCDRRVDHSCMKEHVKYSSYVSIMASPGSFLAFSFPTIFPNLRPQQSRMYMKLKTSLFSSATRKPTERGSSTIAQNISGKWESDLENMTNACTCASTFHVCKVSKMILLRVSSRNLITPYRNVVTKAHTWKTGQFPWLSE